jgi:hypothetical protein
MSDHGEIDGAPNLPQAGKPELGTAHPAHCGGGY